MSSRGFCDRCGLPVRLRKDGTCGAHKDVDFAGGRYGAPSLKACPGAGLPPRKVLQPREQAQIGRPPKQDGPTSNMTLRLSAARRARWERLAARLGVDLADAVRSAVDDACERLGVD